VFFAGENFLLTRLYRKKCRRTYRRFVAVQKIFKSRQGDA
jgi:hypothetical protein